MSQKIKSSERNEATLTRTYEDSYNNDVILGQGKFDVFKLMSLSLSGESVNVAVILN